MPPNKRSKKVKLQNLIILAAVSIIFLIFLYSFEIRNNFLSRVNDNVLQSPSLQLEQPRELPIKQTLSYKLPSGWFEKPDQDFPDRPWFASPDYKEINPENGPGGFYGILISISAYENIPKMTAEQKMIDTLKNQFLEKSPNYQAIHIGNMGGFYGHIHWEGESDYYTVANDKYLWTIDVECNSWDKCSQNDLFRASNVLNSLTFFQ